MNEMTTITQLGRYRGCLLSGAVGDALGAAVEFDDIATIHRRFGPAGILDPAEAYGRIGAITDDTQMTLFTAEGVLQSDDRLERGIGYPPANLWFAYQRWLRTQGITDPWRDGESAHLHHGELHLIKELWSRRAPGNTCISALRSPIVTDPSRPAGPASSDPAGPANEAPLVGTVRAEGRRSRMVTELAPDSLRWAGDQPESARGGGAQTARGPA